MISLHQLPLVNALLNATTATLLVAGFLFVRRGQVRLHKTCMVTALIVSVAFLASYLTYHYGVGSIRFTAQGLPRTIYFAVLISHTLLAVTVLPLALITVWRAFRAHFDSHRRVARWTLPIWLYVSVTGVLIYLMLYRWYPSAELPL